MSTIRQIPSDVIILTVIVLAALGAGFLYGFSRPAAPDENVDPATVEQAVTELPASMLQEPGADEAADADHVQTQPDTSDSTDASAPAPKDEEGPMDASGQVGEERYINLCVQIVIAAMGFQNAGQGHEELADYLPELLENEGVTMAAFEEATDVISNNPRQAERVAAEIVKRVQNRTGVQMDMRVLPLLNPAMSSEGADGR